MCWEKNIVLLAVTYNIFLKFYKFSTNIFTIFPNMYAPYIHAKKKFKSGSLTAFLGFYFFVDVSLLILLCTYKIIWWKIKEFDWKGHQW